MKTDIQIAQEATMLPIKEVTAKIGLTEDDLELYGKYKAKISNEYWNKIKDNEDGKLVLVTAINPTPAGEGKTTITVGLGQALGQLNKKAVIALREPSLGPCFGIKGGAAGGGYSQVVPMEDLNLHFTGDFHAITSANNLLAAMLDNHIQQGNVLGIDPNQIVWKRCVDMNDRQLRFITDGLGGRVNGVPREDGYDITVASEIMAILCLSKDIADLKEKLLKIIEGQKENCEIHVSTDVTKFLKEIHTISFDGIFLDIDMPQMTGIQAAQRVREALPDVGLVFVSSCESMVFEAIKTTPLRFIRKARLEEELEEAVTALLNRYHSLKNYYDFCVNGNTVRLKLSEIYYFESAKHYVKIKTLQEDYMVRAKMADLEQIFNEKGFVRVQSGYIVNLRHVDRVRYKDVLMNNGECISISRDRLEDLKLKHLEFIRRENNL